MVEQGGLAIAHAHRMRFGAEPLDQGGVRFAVWAPGVAAIDLALENGPTVPLAAGRGGWFQADVADTGPGTLYRYRLPDGTLVPDPASRFQPGDVLGPSEVIDPTAFDWPDDGWNGRPWEEAVIYELHIGAFTPAGTCRGAIERLDHLVDLGVTAIELMPVADFPGRWSWGYDGALLFAPDANYGRPDDLKALIAACHRRGLMVFVDVVYNHFGPKGNFLSAYAPQFFNPAHRTPWGAAINFDGPHSATVRRFFIDNALYWLDEFQFDGLRLDAVHAITDDSQPDFLTDLARAVRRQWPERHTHLVLENGLNQARRLVRGPAGGVRLFTAQWNDDVHHALHVLLTGETQGYYGDFADRPAARLARSLASGFAYQGEPSRHAGGRSRGEPSGHLPPTAFVAFLQNHDQVGNRAQGERIVDLAPAEGVRAATSLLLIGPQIPLLFMGEEWGSGQPFPFFCDLGPELAEAVRTGRAAEFRGFAGFQGGIPDPVAAETFATATLAWTSPPEHPAEWLTFYRRHLAVRRAIVVPRLTGILAGGEAGLLAPQAVWARWRLAGPATLTVLANLGSEPVAVNERPAGRHLIGSRAGSDPIWPDGLLPGWTTAWYLDEEEEA